MLNHHFRLKFTPADIYLKHLPFNYLGVKFSYSYGGDYIMGSLYFFKYSLWCLPSHCIENLFQYWPYVENILTMHLAQTFMLTVTGLLGAQRAL